MKKTMMTCIKLGMKTITMKEKISGDFMIQECDMEGYTASGMKSIWGPKNAVREGNSVWRFP